MGLWGHGLYLPVEGASVLDPRARNQAFSVLIREWAGELSKRVTPNSKESIALHNMAKSLCDRHYVLDEVAMLVVTKLEEMVSIHIINGLTSIGALSVTSFEGEQEYDCFLCIVAALFSLIKNGRTQVCMCRRGGGACDLAFCFWSSFSARHS